MEWALVALELGGDFSLPPPASAPSRHSLASPSPPVPNKRVISAGPSPPPGPPPSLRYLCLVCFGESPEQSHLSYSCGNTYGTSISGDQRITRGVCHDCLDLYLASAIDSARVSGDGSIRCFCPSRSCSLRYDREFVLRRVSGSEVTLDRYERFVRNAAVAESGSLRWCPRPGCGNVVTVSVSGGSRLHQRGQCDKCLLTFCSSCGNPHSPLTPCSMVSLSPPTHTKPHRDLKKTS